MVDAKLLRKKLKNGLIVDKWDLVTIIEKQQAEIEALKNRNWELVSEPWGFDRNPAKTLTDEVYFCSRCGKRLGDGIHTCTLPADILRKAQEK